jgi:aminocarboxymuconate-semialdehyde decarboxylase
MWIHSCRSGGMPCCEMEARARIPQASKKSRHFTIDMHCHVLSLAAEQLVASQPQKKAEAAIMIQTMGEASVSHNNTTMLPQAFPKLTQLDDRLKDMDAMGIDVQVISPSPTQYYYWAETELSQQLVQTQNEHIAALVSQFPKRLAGLGTVSLQSPAIAAAQLEVAINKLGLKGVEISTSINGKELSDRSLDVFWQMAERLKAVVFVHPFGSTLGNRTQAYYLVNSVGQPLETTLALSHLIFGGVLERYPALTVVAAHGGGYLPTYIGRSSHAFRVRPEARVDSKTSPDELLKKIWFDTVIYDPMALRHLVERVGVDRVVLGTDYPFDMGNYDVHDLVEETTGLSEADRAAILGENAAQLIGWAMQTAG